MVVDRDVWLSGRSGRLFLRVGFVATRVLVVRSGGVIIFGEFTYTILKVMF